VVHKSSCVHIPHKRVDDGDAREALLPPEDLCHILEKGSIFPFVVSSIVDPVGAEALVSVVHVPGPEEISKIALADEALDLVFVARILLLIAQALMVDIPG